MKYRAHLRPALVLISALCGPTGLRAVPQNDAVTRETAHDIFKQLIEINTTDSVGSYGINGVAIDRDDVRMHGRDERVKVESYFTGVEFYYRFLKALTASRH